MRAYVLLPCIDTYIRKETFLNNMFVDNFSVKNNRIKIDQELQCYNFYNDKISDIHKVINENNVFESHNEALRFIDGMGHEVNNCYLLDEAIEDSIKLNLLLNKYYIFKANNHYFVNDMFYHDHLTDNKELLNKINEKFNPILTRLKYYFLRYNVSAITHRDIL